MSGKYTASHRAPFASNWSKSQHESLASALSVAWRKHKKDCSVDNVTYQQKVILNNQELMQAITEMDTLLQEQPKLPLLEIAEQVIQKIDKSKAIQS